MKFFYQIALYLYKWVCIRQIPFPSNRQVEKDLEKLYPGENKKQLCTEYYVRKLAKSLMICLAGAFFGVVLGVQSRGNYNLDATGTVIRGDYQEETKEVEVECALPGGVQKFKIQVGARVYNEEEIQQLYDTFSSELSGYILGENSSLQEVAYNLYLSEGYEGYPFEVEWKSSAPDIVRSDGTIGNVAEVAQEVELSATIFYEDWEWEKTFAVRVVATPMTQEQRLYQEIENLLLDSERNSRTEEAWELPNVWEGQELVWKEKKEHTGLIVCAGAVVVAVLVYLLADKDLHDNVEKRKQLMKRDYPDVVHKLVIYLGAGMTIRWSFQRMAEDYEQARKEGKKECPIYEEILHTCRELKAGTSEGAAYEHFGKRTGLQEYIRLSTLLTQNLKKGNNTLLQRLREEAQKASLERIQYGKRLGEEAVTKLLMPMVMMLLVVMLMIMIPAFSSVGA